MLLTHQRRNITADYQKMQATLIELSGFMQKATMMIADGLIDQLDEAKIKFSLFQEVFTASEYLADITDDVIYEAFSDTLRENHIQPFVNFNQDHRDQYIRLKFRSLLNDFRAQNTPPPQYQQEENKFTVLESSIAIPNPSILALDQKIIKLQSFHNGFDAKLMQLEESMANLTAVQLKQLSKDLDTKISTIRLDFDSRIVKFDQNF